MDATIIHTNNLTKYYRATRALDNFNMTVARGEFVALLGANGAGKTTLIHVVLGLLPHDPPPSGGTSRILGCANGRLTIEARQRIGYISDDAGPVPWAALNEIARFYSAVYARWDQALFEMLVRKWELDRTRKMKDLSKGQRRLAEFALVMAHHPDLLVLDEPFNGLDAVNRAELQTMLREQRNAAGVTVLYTTHVLDEVERLARRLVLLRAGVKVTDTELVPGGEGVESLFRRHYGMAPAEKEGMPCN